MRGASVVQSEGDDGEQMMGQRSDLAAVEVESQKDSPLSSGFLDNLGVGEGDAVARREDERRRGRVP